MFQWLYCFKTRGKREYGWRNHSLENKLITSGSSCPLSREQWGKKGGKPHCQYFGRERNRQIKNRETKGDKVFASNRVNWEKLLPAKKPCLFQSRLFKTATS